VLNEPKNDKNFFFEKKKQESFTNQNQAILTGWGRTTSSACEIIEPDRPDHMKSPLPSLAGEEGARRLSAGKVRARAELEPTSIIVHAGGRSYGDCALNTGGAVLMSKTLDRIIAFDDQTNIVQVEPGVTFKQLLEHFLPKNTIVPVSPGTGFATIGGAVANDVHGKNHEQAGSFGQHVTELDLRLPDGTLHTIGPNADPSLFAATVGGIGLTGVITRIAFRMKQIPGPAMIVRAQRCQDLDALLSAMAEAASASHSVAWIDGTATGTNLGRGILETAEPAGADQHPRPPSSRLTVPFDFPSATLNTLTVRAFNAAYFRRIPKQGHTGIVHLARFLYPLDTLLRWNRIYGKRGFYQFQCVLPYEAGADAVRDLLERIAASGRASFLSVLKHMGPGRAGYLSFPRPGYTLALDFPARDGVEDFYTKLVERVLHHGGRIYLGKDALLRSEHFKSMYPEWNAFRDVLAHIDPNRHMMSDMRRRLGL
jgi:decaprenylphospho-beta-D-ribofuranose 2-oxidase